MLPTEQGAHEEAGASQRKVEVEVIIFTEQLEIIEPFVKHCFSRWITVLKN